MADSWKGWWRERGDERLSLLLWAIWNPIGPVPLDEYENYTGQVVKVLRKAYESDLELSPVGTDPDDDLQLQRNALFDASVKELVELLGQLSSDRMGLEPDAAADRRAAVTLLAWYEWEMDALGLRS